MKRNSTRQRQARPRPAATPTSRWKSSTKRPAPSPGPTIRERSPRTCLPGLIGNPHAIPTCSVSSFSQSECSPSAQVGYVSVDRRHLRRGRRAAVQPRTETGSGRPARLLPAGIGVAAVHRNRGPHRERLRPRHPEQHDLPPVRAARRPGLPLGSARPGGPQPASLQIAGGRGLQSAAFVLPVRRRRSGSRAGPVHLQPDDLRRAARNQPGDTNFTTASSTPGRCHGRRRPAAASPPSTRA